MCFFITLSVNTCTYSILCNIFCDIVSSWSLLKFHETKIYPKIQIMQLWKNWKSNESDDWRSSLNHSQFCDILLYILNNLDKLVKLSMHALLTMHQFAYGLTSENYDNSKWLLHIVNYIGQESSHPTNTNNSEI